MAYHLYNYRGPQIWPKRHPQLTDLVTYAIFNMEVKISKVFVLP